jgi:signal transduction histidine kinase
MWRQPSSKPPRPFTAVDIEHHRSGSDFSQALIAAGRFFADREVYGLVWIDRDLIVRARFGSKAEFIAVDRPITDSVFPFIGSEDYIESFQTDPSLTLELPGVVIVQSADAQQRYNLSLFWSPEQAHYLLLIARASLDATLEIELLRHVRARLMAEAETKAKSAALSRANRDLEDFASIVSHDLKAPMRAMQYMTEEVETALSAGSLEDARSRLEWIRGQTRRMSSMLSGLLDYSSIGRKIEAVETVDTRALAAAICQSVPDSGGIKVVVEGNWPVLDTLRAPLDLVLRNLVDNAIKHHDHDQGTVRLACADRGEAVSITVADDGPGIAPRHRDVIFLPFRTLERGSTNPAAGVGLGLALVQRTVESVGGQIRIVANDTFPLPTDPVDTAATWKEPEAHARGTTFEVLWPKRVTA